jgi:hypothetical protein
MNCLKTNYLKVQNETLTAELLVVNEKIFQKKRARLSVNHPNKAFFKMKENQSTVTILKKTSYLKRKALHEFSLSKVRLKPACNQSSIKNPWLSMISDNMMLNVNNLFKYLAILQNRLDGTTLELKLFTEQRKYLVHIINQSNEVIRTLKLTYKVKKKLL